MLQVDDIRMTLLYYLVNRNKFSIFMIPNWVYFGKLCNASNMGECLMSWKLRKENPMII